MYYISFSAETTRNASTDRVNCTCPSWATVEFVVAKKRTLKSTAKREFSLQQEAEA